MSVPTAQWKSSSIKIFANPHFWAIFLLTAGITALYYRDILLPSPTWSWSWPLEIFEFRFRLHGILYCIPFIYAAVIFRLRGALITWLITAALTVPKILYFNRSTADLVSNVLYLLIPLAAVFYITLELKWREKERKVLAEREAERQDYMLQIFKAQENERQRLARELHDDTTQTLLVIATRAEQLSTHENVKDSPLSREQAEWIKDTALSVSEELRRISLDLRPGILDNLGLLPALRWLVMGLSQDGIKARLDSAGTARELTPEMDINIFRIVQEAVNNIRRHSRATEVYVRLDYSPDTVSLTIQDNGRGFVLPRTTGGLTASGKLGLAGMQQRVNSLNGIISIDTEPGRGTCIRIEIKA